MDYPEKETKEKGYLCESKGNFPISIVIPNYEAATSLNLSSEEILTYKSLRWTNLAFLMQGWWLLKNSVELTTAAVIANCLVFLLG